MVILSKTKNIIKMYKVKFFNLFNLLTFLKLLKKVLVLCIFAFLFLVVSCHKKDDLVLIETLAVMDNPVYKGKIISGETKEEIRRVLKQYNKDIQDQIMDTEELGLLYKNLAMKYLEIDGIKQEIAERISKKKLFSISHPGTEPDRERALYEEIVAIKYMDKKIYREALNSLDKALEIFPENEVLYYYSGICAANIGKTLVLAQKWTEGSTWFKKAEVLYKRAIELDPYYVKALYALSILLVYELDRSIEAEGFLKRIKARQKSNTDAIFLLARIYYLAGRYEEAVYEYELIEEISGIEDIKQKARDNKKKVLDELYEVR